ncbi:surface antigen family protein [Ehrlichia chaffeensis str. Liberty]|uniref:P44/Msp2 family outer membrane protein n=1 Tax=Ehrlichia chaffeensis TaxID=945 RepID=UPI000444E144|nr:P44/Msp2 family outer membrane protein [Ehrlichia chaffeensis]AHX05139.1 surface antigen family protein [Ehrlichia chaffeensis str. Jax]AHX06128.1 surface antigen family protein [Ehrlichia chaffeensis str. Liberty]
MNCKKFFITTALVSLISFLPGILFSDPVQDDNVGGNFYISGKYVPSASHFGVFSAKEEKNPTVALYGLKQDWNGVSASSHVDADFNNKGYSFKYENNPFLGFAGAIGYSMGGPRVEFEVSYETFDVKNQGGNYKNDAHRYCALDRKATSTSATANNYVLLKNEGLLDISLMLNVCYDIINENIPFSPYMCAGVGTDLISMFKAINPKISYQGKLGLSYSINPEASVFIGGHFHKVAGNEFRDISTLKAFATPSSAATPDLATVTLSVCHFGVELGGRFNF